MPRSLFLLLSGVMCVSGVIFPTLAPYTAVYVTLVAMIAGFVILSSHYWDIWGLRPFLAISFAFVVLAANLPFVWQGSNDLMAIVALLPILAALGGVMLLSEEPRYAHPTIVGMLCLSGAIASLIVGLNDLVFVEAVRAAGDNNAIHYGGIAVLTGFMSLVGLFGTKSAWRFIFLAGPVMGFTSALFSGSRGPALAALLLGLACAPWLLVWFWKDRVFKLAIGAGILVFVCAFWLSDQLYFFRALSFFQEISSLWDGDALLNPATDQRFIIYKGALEAFTEAPFFGHGIGRMMSAASAHFPPEFTGLGTFDHLHSDIADFAVLGGVFGLVAYFAFLAAPLLAVIGMPKSDMQRAAFLGGIIITVGYFALGLTNAMFGILPQTTLYAVLLSMVIVMSRPVNTPPE